MFSEPEDEIFSPETIISTRCKGAKKSAKDKLNSNGRDGGSLNIECPRCSERFNSFPAVNEHLLHECTACVVPKFECERCHRMYKHRSSLRKHLRYECGVFPQFKCPICGYRCLLENSFSLANFNHSIWLSQVKETGRLLSKMSSTAAAQQHLSQKQSSEKKFQCPRCDKKYEHQGTLSRHLHYECGVTPQFDCPFCSYRSKHKANLKTHMVHRHAYKG
ncbi:hypothetical protein LSTR_LSTR000955 [Laodelphax striatellus]|uniref:C2H2-type domain-containing protein n=1 Tax=Laodelphax striatellus TaxID=195883 RepID=A0A482X0U2_LAOST|nr:hypothetical protein LSTR_LSTR000955 [Laodelphax striatellus]